MNISIIGFDNAIVTFFGMKLLRMSWIIGWNVLLWLYLEILFFLVIKNFTAIKAFKCSNCLKANSTSSSLTFGNSSTPLGQRKHLKPTTPSAINFGNSLSLPGMIPPQNPTSVQIWPAVAFCFSNRFATVVVGGIELLCKRNSKKSNKI